MARAAVRCGLVMALAMPAAAAGQPPSTFEGDARVAVYALHASEPREWTRASLPQKDDGTGPAFARFRKGPLAVQVVGDRGPCFAAIERHLRSAVAANAAAKAALAIEPVVNAGR